MDRLVPVTRLIKTKGKKPATDYWFALEGDSDERVTFATAGLWSVEREDLLEPEHPRRVHTMVTTEANDLVGSIHAKRRMPVVLRPDDYEI